MHKILHLFKHGWLDHLQIPGYIRQEFLEESVRKNDFSLRIICGIIFAAELFNIARVVFCLSPVWERETIESISPCTVF